MNSLLHAGFFIHKKCPAATEPAWQCKNTYSLHHPAQQYGQDLDQALLIGSAIAVCQCLVIQTQNIFNVYKYSRRENARQSMKPYAESDNVRSGQG